MGDIQFVRWVKCPVGDQIYTQDRRRAAKSSPLVSYQRSRSGRSSTAQFTPFSKQVSSEPPAAGMRGN